METEFPKGRADHGEGASDILPITRADNGQLHHQDRRLIAASPAMQALLQWVAQIAATDHPVLLMGETGVGKELVAREIHARSPRHKGSFVPVNCGAIPDALIEGELFGYQKGAFTGAGTAGKPGLVEEAHRGTLFLDEVGELRPMVQSVLLRFLDSGEFRRLGDTKDRHVNVRVVSATNRLLVDEVADDRFRPDLYYRLRGFSRVIPPLRERPEDLEAFIERWSSHRKRAGQVYLVRPEAVARLRQHPWPGNLRELQNVLEAAALSTHEDIIGRQPIEEALRDGLPRPRPFVTSGALDRQKRLQLALEENHGRIGDTAKYLNVHRSTVWHRLRRHGLR